MIDNLSQLPVYAAGIVTLGGGAITFQKTTGRVVAARSGAGVVTLTSQDELAANESIVVIQLVGNTGSAVQVDDTSNTIKTVRTFAVDGVTATDKSFKYVIYSLPVAQ